MRSRKKSAPGDQSLQEALAINVRRARERRGMTVPELARRAKCSLKFIEDLEKGRPLKLVRLRALGAVATALDTDEEKLVRRSTPR
jgi:transcriptional regulator with XRE-family HTH domain